MSKEHGSAEEARLIPRMLVRLVELVTRRPYTTLAIAALLAALSIYISVTQLTFLTQRSDLVSPKVDYQQRWRQYLEEFGDDDDMVVVVEGDDQPAMQKALQEIAEALNEQPELFDRVFYKVDLRSLRNRALLYLPTEQLRDIQANIKSMNLLLETPGVSILDPLFGWKSLTLSHLLEEGERRIFSYHIHGSVRPADEQFFRQLAHICDVAGSVVEDPAKYRNPWLSVLPAESQKDDRLAKPQYFFSGDGRLAFLLVRPVKDMSTFTLAQDSIDGVRKILRKAQQTYPHLAFGLTGLPVLENDEMVASQTDTATASWLALLGVTVLYLVVYRCLRYPLLTVTTLVVGTMWAFGWLTVTIGHLNILSATFGVMLIGLGDYGVLWVTRYELECSRGADPATAMRLTAAQVGPSILTAALTTSLGFFSAMFVDFRAVRELGWIAGSGVLLCALSCFTVLPACMQFMKRKPVVSPPVIPLADRTAWLPFLTRRPLAIVGVSAFLLVFFGFFASNLRYDHNLLNLQSPKLDSVQWELKMIEHTAGASWYAISYTSTPEEALALKERYQKLPGVSEVVEVASLIPRDQDMKLQILRDIYHRLRRLPERGKLIPHSEPRPENVKRLVTRLLDTLPSPGIAAPLAIGQIRESLLTLQQILDAAEPGDVGPRLKVFEDQMARDLADDLHRLREVCTPEPILTTDLPESLRDRYVGKTGKWRLCIFGKGSLWEYGPLGKFVEEVQQVDPEATGKPFSTLAGLKAMRDGFVWACVYASLAMLMVLLVDFRNPWHMLLALSPLVIGIVFTFGVMGLFGLSLNPANMIALPLILGVGADNGVHVVHDYLSRRGATPYTLGRSTGRGIFVAALTTILGFGTLMISHHRGLAGLGLLLTIGVSCCLMAALIFLPSLLTILDRRQRRPSLTSVSLPPKAKAA